MGNSIIETLRSLVGPTDEHAMWRVRVEEDPQAFALLVARWQKPIQNLCTRMLGDRHRGEDLAQEVFLRLFSRRQQYEMSGRFSTFLWRMALNLCYDEIRRNQRRPQCVWESGDERIEPFLAGSVGPDPAPDERLADKEQAEAVRQALLELAEPYRVVVVLRHYEGLKFREIAELLEIPEGTVKSRLAEALQQLARTFDRSGHSSRIAARRSAARLPKSGSSSGEQAGLPLLNCFFRCL